MKKNTSKMENSEETKQEGAKNEQASTEMLDTQEAQTGEMLTEKSDTQEVQTGGMPTEKSDTQGAQTGENVAGKTDAQEAENGKTKEPGQDKEKKSGRSRVRMVLGIAIMLVGLCVCLYPLYRQKKSDNFNENAINMILTPQPTKEGTVQTPDKEEEPTLVPQITQTAQAVSDVSDDWENLGVPGQDDSAENIVMLGEDLLENPDAPEQDEEEEKENANRLNGKTVIGVIQIPKIELIYAIVEGSDAAEIGVAIGHMSNTAQLGEIGNCALAGHRGGYSGPYFKNLDKLEIGDEVIITNAKQQVFTYKVTEMMVVQPEEVWVIEDTGEEVAMLTLVTCESDGAERLIVRCVVP